MGNVQTMSVGEADKLLAAERDRDAKIREARAVEAREREAKDRVSRADVARAGLTTECETAERLAAALAKCEKTLTAAAVEESELHRCCWGGQRVVRATGDVLPSAATIPALVAAAARAAAEKAAALRAQLATREAAFQAGGQF
jgi:hypothetical protein